MQADGGTLFLDELGTTSLNLQVKLLRVLEEMSFRRVGGDKLVNVDVRIVAATNLDLEDAVERGEFRDDLFYRLNVFPIHLPPLRDRAEDIPLLLQHFVRHISEEYGLKPPVIAADALAAIQLYDWPGNVRQLRAMVERWVIVSHGRTLLREMLPASMQDPGMPVDGGGGASFSGGFGVDDHEPLAPQLQRVQEQFERAYLHKVLLGEGGHLQRTAQRTGFTRRTLYSKMKAYGMDPGEYRRGGRDDEG
jgi:two-component system nitrogen regulation response regulator NtrX